MSSPRIILLLFVFVFRAFADDDSTKTYRMSDVVITGTKTALPVDLLSSSVQVYDSTDLANANGISVADKLKYASGSVFRSYGGNGALQSISVRGLGSDYSLILLNGQRYTMHQISTVDLGLFSSHEVERIEVASGGNSSLYGADAVGGVINIITKKPDGKTSLSLLGAAGSFGMTEYRISAATGSEQFSWRAAIHQSRAANDFSFKYNDGLKETLLRRTGSDYLLRNYSLSGRISPLQSVVSDVTVRLSNADRGQPSVVTGIIQNNRARINDRDLFVNSTSEISIHDRFSLSIPITYHFNRQRYRDPNIVIAGQELSSFYENTILSVSPNAKYALSPEHHLIVGSEVSRAGIESNEVVSTERNQISLYYSSHHRWTVPFDITLFPSIRYDAFSDIRGDISPKIGVNILLLQHPLLRFRSSIGKNYRVPTFNDLYWIDGGNANLTPERSVSFDAGIISDVDGESYKTRFEVNYFSIHAKDKIVWMPGSKGIWSPKNLQTVQSTGVELTLSGSVLDGLVNGQYRQTVLTTLKTSADYPNDPSQNKILPYVPQQYSALIIGSSYKHYSVNVLYSITGYRYETADNNARFILPTHDTYDVNASALFEFQQFSLRIKGEMNNLFDKAYELVTDYPMPLKNYLFSLEIIY